MSQYFDFFPTIDYEGVEIRDISRRANFIRTNLSNPMLFLPFTIEDGMKAEDVANAYYGSVDYTWLVLLANDMLDPYTDWPMDHMVFTEYLMAKYAEQSGATFYDVIEWISSHNNPANILFYYRTTVTGEEILVGPETFSTVDAAAIEDFVPMRIYDYEVLLNESKRNIQLVDIAFRDTVANEFANIIKI
jgi:hypothetical protein